MLWLITDQCLLLQIYALLKKIKSVQFLLTSEITILEKLSFVSCFHREQTFLQSLFGKWFQILAFLFRILENYKHCMKDVCLMRKCKIKFNWNFWIGHFYHKCKAQASEGKSSFESKPESSHVLCSHFYSCKCYFFRHFIVDRIWYIFYSFDYAQVITNH